MLPPKRTLARIEVSGTARFLTFSCFRRHKIFSNDRIKDRFVDHLNRVAIKQGVEIVAWVIMPEHVHVLALLEGVTGESFCRSLKSPFSAEILRRWRELDTPLLTKLRDRAGVCHFWQKGGGYDRNVVVEELTEKIRYCHANPVARGLCATSVDWPWSSARMYESRPDAMGPPIAFGKLPNTSKPLT